jgi:hypothetical protein
MKLKLTKEQVMAQELCVESIPYSKVLEFTGDLLALHAEVERLEKERNDWRMAAQECATCKWLIDGQCDNLCTPYIYFGADTIYSLTFGCKFWEALDE